MRVSYAINECIGGAGIGTPAYYACAALADGGYLQQVLALGYQCIGKTDFRGAVEVAIPFGKACSNIAFGLRTIFPGFPAYTLRDNLFDALAVRKLRQCEIFHGWNHHCLRMLRKAKQWNAVTIVERGSTHSDYQNRILREEYRRYRMPFPPVEHTVVQRCKKEFAEADYVLVNSPFAYQTFLNAGIDAGKLRCIPRGVDLARFTATRREPPEHFTVLYAGLISLRKGVQYLLEAWEALQLPNAELVLVGAIVPDGRAILQKYLRNPTISYRGFVADMRGAYRQASLLVLPTLEEGSAKVTFEAMAASLPVITTPNAGSAVREGKEGFLVPIREVRALQQRIRYFYDHPTEIAKFGRRAQVRAEQYSWGQYQRNMLEMYRSVTR